MFGGAGLDQKAGGTSHFPNDGGDEGSAKLLRVWTVVNKPTADPKTMNVQSIMMADRVLAHALRWSIAG